MTMKFDKFDEHVLVDDQWLKCPVCGETYLHQGRVIVFNRDEDDPETVETHVSSNSLRQRKIQSEDSNNPSGRRHGLTIEFTCEHHEGTMHLQIAQHKGCTLLSWRTPVVD